MKVLVFSDSHGRVEPMLEAVEHCRPDAVFHLGDVMPDAEKVRAAYPELAFYRVCGNCDYFAAGAEPEGVVRLEGKTIFYLHGHTQAVKLGLDRALYKASALGADILLYGHTHRPLAEDRGGLLAVNPGAVLDCRAALLTWERGGEVDYRLMEI